MGFTELRSTYGLWRKNNYLNKKVTYLCRRALPDYIMDLCKEEEQQTHKNKLETPQPQELQVFNERKEKSL